MWEDERSNDATNHGSRWIRWSTDVKSPMSKLDYRKTFDDLMSCLSGFIPSLIQKEQLQCKLMRLVVPVAVKPAFSLINRLIWYFERYSFIRLARKQNILIVFVGDLDLLFVCWHKTMTRLNSIGGFRVIDFKCKRSLMSLNITRLCYLCAPCNVKGEYGIRQWQK